MPISSPGDEMSDLIPKRDYKKLLTDLQRIIREGKQEAERAATLFAHREDDERRISRY